MSKQEARLLLILLAFILDSVMAYFLPFDYTKDGVMFVSGIGMMVFIFINHFLKKQDHLVYSIGVGLYFAFMYGKSLLIYVLIYTIIGFLGTRYERIASFRFFEMLLFFIGMFVMKEVIIFELMKFTEVTSLGFGLFLKNRLLPSVGINIILFIPLYFGFLYYQRLALEMGYEC